MTESFNSEHKNIIRTKWNKPLIEFLTRRISDKLIYCGLPSADAVDVLEWIEFIRIVIAFQCRQYPNASNENQARTQVEKLETLLNNLERENKIDNYILYDGYLEEIVLRGYDNSPTRINFDVKNFITLYNLDFCNKISSPIEFVNVKGEIETAYKFNAINKLLNLQKSLSDVSNRFILFLTVHCSYDGEELDHFLRNPPSSDIEGYLKKCNDLKGHEKNARIVRIFVAYHIQHFFYSQGFSPMILPTLLYQGIKKTFLLHFTIFGLASKNSSGGAPCLQKLNEILGNKFISIDQTNFINKAGLLEEELDVELNPIKLFVESKTFLRLWNQKN
jgi:hypothetical protein